MAGLRFTYARNVVPIRPIPDIIYSRSIFEII